MSTPGRLRAELLIARQLKIDERTDGLDGFTQGRQARSDSVQAARKTLVMSPPNAVLTVSRSASGIEAKATARRLVNGALNALRGRGPLIDDNAGGIGSGSLVPRN